MEWIGPTLTVLSLISFAIGVIAMRHDSHRDDRRVAERLREIRNERYRQIIR
jgi:hypothetical protein